MPYEIEDTYSPFEVVIKDKLGNKTTWIAPYKSLGELKEYDKLGERYTGFALVEARAKFLFGNDVNVEGLKMATVATVVNAAINAMVGNPPVSSPNQ